MKITITQLIKVAVIFALMTQISHASYVFRVIARGDSTIINTVSSYIFAIALELAIYIFTMKGKKQVALFFAIISTSINLLYYFYEPTLSREFIGMLVISPIIPMTIWFYSDLIKEDDLVDIMVTQDEIPQQRDIQVIEKEDGTKQVKLPVGRPTKEMQRKKQELLDNINQK